MDGFEACELGSCIFLQVVEVEGGIYLRLFWLRGDVCFVGLMSGEVIAWFAGEGYVLSLVFLGLFGQIVCAAFLISSFLGHTSKRMLGVICEQNSITERRSW